MDILHLVDRLEELFNESRPLWLTHSVIVDEDRMLDLIDQMRVAIPEEIKKAQQIIAQRDRILAQAKEEANRTIALARDKAEKSLEDDELIMAASSQANQIVERAQQEASLQQREADQYILDSLGKLEVELDQLLSQVRNGITALKVDSYPQNTPNDEQPPMDNGLL
jgi:cell division septum initiation protein DivIVA